MITLNMHGKPCPIPMLEAKKAIEKLNGKSESIQVLVDNEVACENIKKMADGSSLKNEYHKIAEDEYVMEITVGEGEGIEKSHQTVTRKKKEEKSESTGRGTVVAIGQNTMGKGEEELGKILIKGFIYSLTELSTLPEKVIFFNSGVTLACEGSTALEDLITLREKGTQIFACGTCLDYYQKKEKLQIGEITDMYRIASMMSEAEKVINI